MEPELTMRIRSIKPEFWESESLGRVSRDARLLFIGLWMLADDSGRARGGLRESSRALASLLFPYDDDAKSLASGWLQELIKEGCVINYEVGGNHYLEIPNFLKHQRIDKPSKSKYPPFQESSSTTPGVLPESSSTTREPSRARIPSLTFPSLPEGGCKGETEIPTLEQAIASVMTCGIPDDFAKYVYEDWSSRGGRDGADIQVAFVRYAAKRWSRESVEWRAKTHKGNKPPGQTVNRDGSKQISASDAWDKELARIKA